MIKIALILFLLELAAAYNTPIQNQTVGKNINVKIQVAIETSGMEERRPCGDQDYCESFGEEHTLCKYCGVDKEKCGKALESGPVKGKLRERILDEHNEMRRKVAKGEEDRGLGGGQPTATNMNKLKWNDELAKVAQRWAEQCTGGHDDERGTKKYQTVGQNMAWEWRCDYPPFEIDPLNGIKGWYEEVKDFPTSQVSAWVAGMANGKIIGHYTQMVWAKTKEIGCGYIMVPCKTDGCTFRDDIPDGISVISGASSTWLKNKQCEYRQIFVVCNYGPTGNYIGQPIYKSGGKPGSDCPNGHDDGLCNW